MSESTPANPLAIALYGRVLSGDAGAAQVWFEARVLDRYREQRAQGTRVMRTNSAGRVKSAAGWSLDFGIAGEQEELIHTSAADLAQRVPAGEQMHWARHVALLPVSPNFLAMRLRPGSCFDDGDLRDWENAGAP